MSMTRLSESKLWTLMSDYYHDVGPDAWAEGAVPFDISTNKYIADIYAELILAVLQSVSKVHVVELGAGHGRLGFYILKLIEEIQGHIDNVKYIMTDIAHKNLESWQKHPALQGYIKSGALDLSLFNAVTDNSLKLENSQQVISKGSLDTPIVVINNYLFDTLPHDAFIVKNNKLHENAIDIKTSSLDKLKYDFIAKECSTEYYGNKFYNTILQEYLEHYNEASILIPIGGLESMNTIESFTSAETVYLVADKAIADLDEMDNLDDPEISLHGSVSLMVNFDAIRRYIELKGGNALMMPNKYSDFQIACFINKKDTLPGLTVTFHELLSDFTPQDLFNLCYNEEDEFIEAHSIDYILSILQLTKWDPNIVHEILPQLIQFIEDKDEIFLSQEKVIIQGVTKAWDYFYAIDTKCELAFELGNLYYSLEKFDKAIEFFKIASDANPSDHEVFYNLALCYNELDEEGLACNACEQALHLSPNYKDAKRLKAEL